MGGVVKLGHPFLGRYMKMGQSRTWDGWGVQMSLKIWDVLYGCSLIMINELWIIIFMTKIIILAYKNEFSSTEIM